MPSVTVECFRLYLVNLCADIKVTPINTGGFNLLGVGGLLMMESEVYFFIEDNIQESSVMKISGAVNRCLSNDSDH